MTIESSRSSLEAEILEKNNLRVTLKRKLDGGVSSSQVWLGNLPDDSQKEVVVKWGIGLGTKEQNGESKLKGYLPLAPNIAFGIHHAVYEKVEGQTLHDAVKEGSEMSQRLFEEYVQLHMKLWANTQVTKADLGGYANKTTQTVNVVENLQIPLISGDPVVLGEIADMEWVVNGHTIGTLTERLNLMQFHILTNGPGVMAHGDEGAGNAIIENGSGKIKIIDCGDAGIRSVHEPIAKLLLWFDATITELERFSFRLIANKVYLDTKQTIPGPVNLAINRVSKLFGDYIDEPSEIKKTSSYMMMYLLREIQWLKARGREDIMPYLLAKSLMFSLKLDDVK